MPEREIPERVRALIRRSIDSIVELEAILLLREHEGREWTASEAGARLYVSLPVASYVLAALVDKEFFTEQSARYRYAPATPQLRADVDGLAVAYSAALVAVTAMVHSKPGQNVLEFAKAFQIRRDK